ncbi:tRNA dihydrouridine synthase DusB [Candidatus Hepatobacter penaei]|uniref:tRNA dihydrouridine synthase DusB n=1 Tax=Candidatus Hepatobacter penaei TaxID=1274402 RepID=UPI0004F37008|nr:tRNA dihydrouridine synthase DusB [Candidatus Hepatobacter penaei]TGW15706.1 tRNA dihydrouridine synthase DusB [bacterium NHP-B]
MLAVGSVSLPGNVFLAPMSGVSDVPFRDLVTELGGGCVVSEMIASESMVRQTRQSLRMARPLKRASTLPTIIQLAGVKPCVMAEAAKLAVDLGADIVDINMGCPAKKIVNHYAGSALMRDTKKAHTLLEAVVKAVSVPVTLKMRKGWDDSTQNAPELAHIAQDVGVQMITIHGRTRCQFYQGSSDWSFFRQVKKRVSIPVVGNGDIKTPDQARHVMDHCGVDGVMVGRGCYGKPWLIAQVQTFLATGQIPSDPSLSEQKRIVLQHLDAILHVYGKEAGVRIARKHLGWYSKGLPEGASFRARVNQIGDAAVLVNVVSEFYEKQCDEIS